MKNSKLTKSIVALIAMTILTVPGGSALGAEWTLEKDQLVEKPKPYSRYVDQHFPKRVFFDDTHHHSSFSADSGMFSHHSRIIRRLETGA